MQIDVVEMLLCRHRKAVRVKHNNFSSGYQLLPRYELDTAAGRVQIRYSCTGHGYALGNFFWLSIHAHPWIFFSFLPSLKHPIPFYLCEIQL